MSLQVLFPSLRDVCARLENQADASPSSPINVCKTVNDSRVLVKCGSAVVSDARAGTEAGTTDRFGHPTAVGAGSTGQRRGCTSNHANFFCRPGRSWPTRAASRRRPRNVGSGSVLGFYKRCHAALTRPRATRLRAFMVVLFRQGRQAWSRALHAPNPTAATPSEVASTRNANACWLP